MTHLFPLRLFRILLTGALALGLTGCPSNQEKKDTMAAKIHEKTSIPDQSNDTNFIAFMTRLRMAVTRRDLPTIASMMTTDFGYRLDPPGEGDGVFAYWDKNNVWPELNAVLRETFVADGVFMTAPGAFVKSKISSGPNAKPYTGYRAGITLVEGGWRFAYFVNN
jgi:hypothetical protein